MSYSYQYKLNGSNVPIGGTSASYGWDRAIESDGGSYTLVVTNDESGLQRTFGPLVLTVTGNSALTVDADTIAPVAGVGVQFRSDVGLLAAVESYSWDFDDGTTPSTEERPIHYFMRSGVTHTVTLTVTFTNQTTTTATINITPTAPSATAGQTLSKRLIITSSPLNASTYNSAPYSLDAWIGGSASVDSYPIGAKLAAESGLGYHGQSTGFNWMALWSVGTPDTNGLVHQVSGWFRFEQAPANTLEVCYVGASGGGQDVGLGIDASMNLIHFADFTTDIVLPVTVPLKKWCWFAWAWQARNIRMFFKEFGGELYEKVTTGGAYHNTAKWAGCGVLNLAGNINHNSRASNICLHVLDSLDDAGYTNDVVPPQPDDCDYYADYANGDDANDGILAPVKTVTKVNELLNTTSGAISNGHTAGVAGSGLKLYINSSTSNRFDVEDVGLRIKKPGTWLRPQSGSYIYYKPWREISTGEWSATGGYSNIYQISCDVIARVMVYGDGIPFEPVTSLANLDAAAGGASYHDVAGTTLYVKTLGLTDPSSDGITYIHSRLRPLAGPTDTIGCPVVAPAGQDLKIGAIDCHYTAANNNGSYVLGDITGFSGQLECNDVVCSMTDKHAICWTINATDSEITVTNATVGPGLAQVLTDYMSSGSGNIHTWDTVEVTQAFIAYRSVTGTAGSCYYSHGGYQAFSNVNMTNCNFNNNNIVHEAAIADLQITNCTFGSYAPYASNGYTISGCTINNHCVMAANGTFTGNTVIAVGALYHGLGATWSGACSVTNNEFDYRSYSTSYMQCLWYKSGSAAVTFTGNTVRIPNGASPNGPCPVFKDFATADIVSCDNNTYYFPAAAVFAKNFDAGGGPADYTFAQWQSLGFDTNSTRYDP